MKSLYMYYVGGTVAGANIEVHDIQFAAVSSPEEAFPTIAERWFGEQEYLHIDSYAEVTWADGYDIFLSEAPPMSQNRLYFINMGGCEASVLEERHSFSFFVAESVDDAKKRAQQSMLKGTMLPHVDDSYEVDGIVVLDALQGLHIHLTPNEDGDKIIPAFQGLIPIGAGTLLPGPFTARPN